MAWSFPDQARFLLRGLDVVGDFRRLTAAENAARDILDDVLDRGGCAQQIADEIRYHAES